MRNKNKIIQTYQTDLRLHSEIKPLKNIINIEFEKEIEQNVIKYLKRKAKTKCNKTLFAGFVNRQFDCVLVEEMNDKILLLTTLNMKTMKTQSICLERYYTQNSIIKYSKIKLSLLPEWLKRLVTFRNSEKGMHEIYTHRFIATLKYNIKNLEIHHLKYKQSQNPSENSKETDDSIELLLPVTKDFHEKELHTTPFNLITEQDLQLLEEKGNILIETLNTMFEPKNKWNTPNNEVIKQILKNYYIGNKSIQTLADDKNLPSKNTIMKIIDLYKPLINFLECPE